MKLGKTSVALSATIMALATASTVDSASAGLYSGGYPSYFTSFRYQLYRAPQPSQSLPGAMSQPYGNTRRAAPYMGGREMRGAPIGGMGGRR